MIDFHNHILPAVDDGSNSLEMSLNMIKNAAEQGITDVVNTVHYQHPKFDVNEIVNIMATDKKVKDGNINFVLLSEIGKTMMVDSISDEKIIEVLKEL